MEFKNVTVVKKANVYFDGKVTSRTVLFDDGEKKTLGIMIVCSVRLADEGFLIAFGERTDNRGRFGVDSRAITELIFGCAGERQV